MVRFVACRAGLTFGGARLVGAMGFPAVGACVRDLGAWWPLGVCHYVGWIPLGGHSLDLVLGTGNTGLVYKGGFMAADEG